MMKKVIVFYLLVLLGWNLTACQSRDGKATSNDTLPGVVQPKETDNEAIIHTPPTHDSLSVETDTAQVSR